jgi:hypothetical protein
MARNVGGSGGGFLGALAIVGLAIAGVFLGAAAIDKLARPTHACPRCGKAVKQDVSPCPHCAAPLTWSRA